MSFSEIKLGLEEIFTTLIEDSDGRKIGKWVVLKRDYPKVVKILNHKFGLNMKIKEGKKSQDLDWAMGD